jgi:hypothetical protein
MSDEAGMEAAFRHRDLAAVAPWCGARPDEAMMRWEEGIEDGEDSGFSALADWQEEFLVFCFADAAPEEWQSVALRAHAVMRAVCPGVFAARTFHELLAIRAAARPLAGRFPLAHLAEDAQGLERLIGGVLGYYFPDGREWIRHGVQNLYLVARMYQPGLVTRWNGEISYERMAMIFGEIPAEPVEVEQAARAHWCPEGMGMEEWLTAKARARSRWSARAQKLIMAPLRSAGARAPSLYGKTATVRDKYRESALGNQNRRKKI